MRLVVRDEDVQQFGGADAVDHLDAARASFPAPRRRRQRLAGATHFFSDDEIVAREQPGHRAVGGRRGEQHRRAVLGDRRRQRVGRCFLSSTVEAPTEREQQQPAQPEGEGQRRAADEDVVGVGRSTWRGQQAQAGHHVAVEVHRALGLAGGAEVKAMMQVSSFEVFTFSNVAGLAAARVEFAGPFVLKCSTFVSVGQAGRASASSSASRASHSAA